MWDPWDEELAVEPYGPPPAPAYEPGTRVEFDGSAYRSMGINVPPAAVIPVPDDDDYEGEDEEDEYAAAD